jgi:hypothetical protein
MWCPVTVEMVTELSKNELLLWTALHQFGADWGRATPSTAVVCEVTGLSETRLHVAKRGLIDKGYIAVEPQYSEGRQTYNRYVARKAPPGWRVLPDATREPVPAVNPAPSGEGAGNRQGRVPEIGTPEGAAFRYPDYTETNTQRTPLVPQGGIDGRTDGDRVTLTREQVPDELAPVADLFIDWWNHHKGGKRTQLALSNQVGQLRKILEASTPAALTQQLEQAIESSAVGGRRWAGITYSNFSQYRGLAKNGATGYRQPAERPGGTLMPFQFDFSASSPATASTTTP